jgi:creatinine amidohydrolase
MHDGDLRGPAPWEWAAMTAAEVGERARAGAVALWAIGATEQHGPHLATGFDHLVAEAVVRGAARRLGDRAVVVPTLAVGASGHWRALGGTLTLPSALLQQVLVTVARAIGEAGFGRVVVVNGHAGNVGAGLAAAGEFADGRPVVEFLSYWDALGGDGLRAAGATDGGIGHAGEVETSIALHLDALVRTDRVPAAGAAADPSAPGGGDARFHRAPVVARDTRAGVIGDPSRARAELGATVLEAAVTAIVDHCRAAAPPERA